MKFIDWFAGIGGFRRGMELAGHECVGFCEFDKFASASYRSMHTITEQQREYLKSLDLRKRQKEILKGEYLSGEWYAVDIRRVDPEEIPESDCWCFGFPCQDISNAGRAVGIDGSRSSLFFTVMDLIRRLPEEKRPSLLFIENVKNLLSVNKGWDFARLLAELDENGYDAEWSLINSKNFNIPQNRERVFIIGHFRGRSGPYIFPVEGTDGEDNIYQIGCDGRSKRSNPNQYRVYDTKGISPCLNKMDGGGREPSIAIPVLTPDRANKRQNGRRFKEDGEVAFTLTSQDRHGVAVKVSEATKKGYAEAREGIDSINLSVPGSSTRRGRVGKEIANTLDTSCNQGILVTLPDGNEVYAVWYAKKECYIAIRRLTPKECFRLQGWTDDYFERAEFVNSNSQLYKQAGNGVTVNVIQAIAERMSI